MHNKRKSQVFSLDMVFALVVFVFILLTSFWAWYMVQERVYYLKTYRDMNVVGLSAASLLVESSGSPADWQFLDSEDIDTIQSLGLIEGAENIASTTKLERVLLLGTTNYSLVRKSLGIIGPGYEFYLVIGGNSTGRYHENATQVVSVDRIMQHENGTLLPLTLKVWI